MSKRAPQAHCAEKQAAFMSLFKGEPLPDVQTQINSNHMSSDTSTAHGLSARTTQGLLLGL